MKILVVTQYYWPEAFRINELVTSLLDEGCEVEVLTGKPNYPSGHIFDGYRLWGTTTECHENALIHRVPVFPRGKGGGVRLALNYLSFVFMGVLLGPWILRRRNFDAIFVYAPSPILQAIPALCLGKLKKCSVVIWIQDLWPDSLSATGYVHSRLILRSIGMVVRWIYRKADLLLVQSRAFISNVTSMAPSTPVYYYPNSVDDAFSLPPDPSVALPDIPALHAGFSVLFAGNVGSGQAVEVILDSAELLLDYSQINIVVLGKGSRWEWMRQEAIKRNLINLHMPGAFPVATMPGLMKKADVLLVTLADKPVFALTVPNKVQAYMAVGKPILACLNGEGARLIDEANAGITIPPEDGVRLAAGVLKLFRMSRADRETLGLNGKRYFEDKFDHTKLVRRLIKLLQQIAGRERL